MQFPGFVNVVPAVAYCICHNLHAAFSQPLNGSFAEPRTINCTAANILPLTAHPTRTRSTTIATSPIAAVASTTTAPAAIRAAAAAAAATAPSPLSPPPSRRPLHRRRRTGASSATRAGRAAGTPQYKARTRPRPQPRQGGRDSGSKGTWADHSAIALLPVLKHFSTRVFEELNSW